LATVTGAALFAASLDRSIDRIGELAADGRSFDRLEVVRLADIWDNNTFPFLQVALTQRPWLRERRARVALDWMAAGRPERRAWMDAAGGRKLPAPGERRYSRDYAGLVHASSAPLDPAAVALDYDLAGAEVRTLRVERAGTGLVGFADLAVSRRYPAPGAFGDAVLRIRLEEVDAVQFDSADAVGAALARDRSGIEISLGERGRLRAARATVWFDDSAWHLSSTGRAADATTPLRNPEGPEPLPVAVHGPARDAGYVLRQAMLEIRSVRYAKLVGRVPVGETCDAFAGAGSRLLAASRRHGPGRDRAFRSLIGEWQPRLGRRLPRADRPARGRLTLAQYAADATVLNYAAPGEDGRWGLHAEEFARPARLVLTTEGSPPRIPLPLSGRRPDLWRLP
jgi:hypothetical protein